jgi:hypothetical protein
MTILLEKRAKEWVLKDDHGRTFFEEKTEAGFLEKTISVPGLPTGIFFLEIKLEDGVRLLQKVAHL